MGLKARYSQQLRKKTLSDYESTEEILQLSKQIKFIRKGFLKTQKGKKKQTTIAEDQKILWENIALIEQHCNNKHALDKESLDMQEHKINLNLQ